MLDFLISLSAAGQELQAAAAAEDTLAQVAIVQGLTVEERHIVEARRLAIVDASDLWRRLQDEKVVMADLARAFAAIMVLAPEAQALQAATLYTAVLKTPGCPVLSLFDRVICGNLLKLLRDVASKRPSKAKKGAPAVPAAAEPMDLDVSDEDAPETVSLDPMALVTACTEAFAAVLRVLALKDAPETARAIAEAFSEVAALPWLPAAAQDAAFGVLGALIDPRHGGVREVSAMVFKLLTPATLGTLPGGKVGAKEAGAVRTAALRFVQGVIEREAGAREAAAALARAAALCAPERADGRAAAGETAATLCAAMGPVYLHSFLGFVARLSRAPKPQQRLVAVDIAAALLGSLEAPFDPETAVSPAFGPSCMSPLLNSAVAALRGCGTTPASALRADGPAMAPAPWGAVCLAILLGRSADKGPAVRGRALHHLAAVTTANAASPAFLAALAAAEAVDLRAASAGAASLPTATAIKRRGGKGAPTATGTLTPSAATTPGSMLPDGAENTPSNALTTAGRPTTAGRHAGRTAAGAMPGSPAPPPAPVFLVPAALLAPGDATYDVQSLLRRARQRCRDDRAQVRKSAVQLLSAALLAAPAAALAPEDLAALEIATGDPLVTVRRAAAAAVAALAQAFPDSPTAVGLWVSAGLPLVRDPEATVQEAALDQVESLFLSKAAAAAARGGAAADAGGLRPVLAALSCAGAAGRACLARSLAQLRAKGRLQGATAATGLERLLASDALSREEAAGAWVFYAEIAAQAPSAPSWKFLQERWGALGAGNAAAEVAASQDAVELLRVVATAAERFPADQATALRAQLRERLEPLTLPPAAAAGHVAALAQLTRAHGGEEAMVEWTSAMLSVCEAALSTAIESLRHADTAGTTPAPVALFVAGEVALLRSAVPSSRLITLVQALTSPTLAGQAPADGDVDATHASAPVPPAVQALAWASLGKLCLVSEQLAKRCVPLFAHELGRAAAAAVRNNIVIALADLAARYTALVDPHVPRLAACLRDPAELVRLQALALLANLLQKDFLKWRGPLFLRFILALVDPSPRVAALAEYLLSDALESKLPNLAYNHFVEAIFALNDCRVGAGAGAGDLAGAAAAEGEGFALKGSHPEARAKRDAVYQALLRRMAPEHKFATAARLCQEVLGGAADGALPLSECGEVVGDALRVLSCKAIKVSGAGRGAAAPDDADAGELAGAAKGRLVSQMMKKHLVEAVVPVVIELKRGMEVARHPLLADLMAAAAAMLKDHKSEIEDILAADRQLAKEILYDIRQAEAAEAARAAEERGAGEAVAATAAKTPRAAGGAGTRPPGTSGQTPIAAEVLRKAGRTGGGGAATPKSAPHSALPGTRPRSQSRLARTSLAPLSIGGAELRAEPSPTPPRLHPGRSPPPPATAAAAAAAEEEGPEDHVELRFVVPGGEEAPSPRLWNIPAAVASPEVGRGGSGGGVAVAAVPVASEEENGGGEDMVDVEKDEAPEGGRRRGRSAAAAQPAPAVEGASAGVRTRRKRRA